MPLPRNALYGALGAAGGLGGVATQARCAGACNACLGCVGIGILIVAAALIARRKSRWREEAGKAGPVQAVAP